MKKIILIVVILIIVGGLYWTNSKSSQNIDERNSTTQAETDSLLPNDNLSSTTAKVYDIAEVEKHNKAGDCWTTINGIVYDLTTWPEKHPGGDKAIFAICGIDGTKAFEKTHGGQDKPAGVLDGFYIGNLKK